MAKLILILAAGFSAISLAPKPAAVSPTSTSTVAVVQTTSTTLVPQAIVTKWEKVAHCETHGNWKMHGSRYSGGLGFRNDVWLAYGGAQFAPHAGAATKEQQIVIARRINADGYVPDQDGECHAW